MKISKYEQSLMKIKSKLYKLDFEYHPSFSIAIVAGASAPLHPFLYVTK